MRKLAQTIGDDSLDRHDAPHDAVLLMFVSHVCSEVCVSSEKRCSDDFMFLCRVFQGRTQIQ